MKIIKFLSGHVPYYVMFYYAFTGLGTAYSLLLSFFTLFYASLDILILKATRK